MQWFIKISKAVDSQPNLRPPAYLIERISDLNYVMELSQTSPTEAKLVLSHIIEKLVQHSNNEYVVILSLASKTMLDSPVKARDLVQKVIAMMAISKKRYENEKGIVKWKK